MDFTQCLTKKYRKSRKRNIYQKYYEEAYRVMDESLENLYWSPSEIYKENENTYNIIINTYKSRMRDIQNMENEKKKLKYLKI